MSARLQLINQTLLSLGGGMIDIELDPEHLHYAVDYALDRYRQRSGNAIEESFLFMDLQPDVQVYTLPAEVQEVRCLYRRAIGDAGASVDPSSLLAPGNSLYAIQGEGDPGGGAGALTTYDFAMQFQTLVDRLFGRDLLFTWDTASKRLTVQRAVPGVETVMLHIFNARPEEVLLNDVYAKPWLRDMSIAMAKKMLGEARSKFASLAGPQGGVSLNGDALKQEAQAEFERLEGELQQLVDAHGGYDFIIG